MGAGIHSLLQMGELEIHIFDDSVQRIEDLRDRNNKTLREYPRSCSLRGRSRFELREHS